MSFVSFVSYFPVKPASRISVSGVRAINRRIFPGFAASQARDQIISPRVNFQHGGIHASPGRRV